MELFREEYLTIQDDYLSVDPSREGSDGQDVDYDNDDLGENTEITPLGDAVEKENEVNDFIGPGPGDDDDFEGDDADIALDEDIEEDDDGFVDASSQIDPDEYDDDDLDEDDDLDTSLDLDEEDDFVDDDDDLITDEDDDFDDEDTTARTSIDTSADFSSRPHGRVTGTMLDHEPGLPGSDKL